VGCCFPRVFTGSLHSRRRGKPTATVVGRSRLWVSFCYAILQSSSTNEQVVKVFWWEAALQRDFSLGKCNATRNCFRRRSGIFTGGHFLNGWCQDFLTCRRVPFPVAFMTEFLDPFLKHSSFGPSVSTFVWTATVLWPLYRTTFVSWLPMWRAWRFCWSKILLPAC